MKNTKKKQKGQSKVVKSSFQQVDVASSLSITQACLRESGKLGSAFVYCNISGSNITKYSGINTVAKYMNHQKKDKFKRQEHRTFINWFISVPAKITRSGHQTEIKMYENHFHKADWKELDRLIEAA